MSEEKAGRRIRLRTVAVLGGVALFATVLFTIVMSPSEKRRPAKETRTPAVENKKIKPDANIHKQGDDGQSKVKPRPSEKSKPESPEAYPKPEPAPAASKSSDRIAEPDGRKSTVRVSTSQKRKVKRKAASKKAARPASQKPAGVGAMPGVIAGSGAAAPENASQRDTQLPVGVGPVSDPSPTEIIDMLLERMERANIAFNAPRSMNIGDSPKIQLLLSLGDTEEELKASIKAAGEKIGAEIRVNNRMQARLSGYMFQITAITPEEQAVSRRGRTEWSWEIHPKKEGQHDLHLTLSAIFEVNGRETRRVVRTFDRVIEVNVSAPQKITAFVKGNWQWLWAAVLVPIAGWLWRRRRG